MRIRWRGLELPSRVIRDEAVSTDSYGRFVVEPFEHGFGTTIGNSLRRILLSSLEGSAVTSVKIAGVAHEFFGLFDRGIADRGEQVGGASGAHDRFVQERYGHARDLLGGGVGGKYDRVASGDHTDGVADDGRGGVGRGAGHVG